MMTPEARTPEFAGTRRFEIVRVLGEGGMGVVYEAIDRERGVRVALKTLTTLEADARSRFKNEFRSLQDIQHPHLASLGELFEEGAQLFFTMELVRGVDFVSYVRPREGGETSAPEAPPIPDDDVTAGPATRRSLGQTSQRPVVRGGASFVEARIRSAFGQLARGLVALHRAQKVHRDIKPSNVLVTEAGRVVILDFGLVTDVTRGDRGRDRSVVGTAHFMAPEQAAARAVGPEADWYSVGVMLYLALTGTYPFPLASEVALDLKQRVEPTRPALLVDGLPIDLEALCVDLLRIDPAARPTGREVLARLHVREDVDGPHLLSLASDFVGRQHELLELRDAFLDARQGGGVTVLVQGESGVGKSALVRRFLEGVEGDTIVLAGRCYERESVPYKAVDEVIDGLSRHLAQLAPAEIEALLPPNVGLLGGVFPVLRRVAAIAAAPPSSSSARPASDGSAAPRSDRDAIDPQELRTRAFAALRELFRRLADARPLVIAIDDLHWADADGLALLAEVVRSPGAPRLLLVATTRDAYREQPPSRRSAVPSIGPGSSPRPSLGNVRRIPLLGLPADDAQELIHLLLRRASVEAASSPRSGEAAPTVRTSLTAPALAEEAGGHPLFIDALVRHRLVQGNESGPARLEDVLWSRVVRLDVSARRILDLVAVAGRPVQNEIAAHAANVKVGELVRLVGLLRAANLVRTSTSGPKELIEPYHDRVRETVLTHLDERARRAWHRRFARALEASGHAEMEALATHFRDAGDTERAAGYASQAGDQAAEALAFDRAAGLYRMAIDLHRAEGEGERVLLTKLGDALGNAGRGAEAAEAYLGATFGAPPAEALELERRAAENLLRCGYVDEGIAGLRSVLAAVGMEMPETPRHALASLAARRRGLLLRGLRVAPAEASPDRELLRRIDVSWSAALGLAMVDPIRGADFQTRNVVLSLDAGEPYRAARALALEAAFVSAEGGRARARVDELLAAAEVAAARTENPHALGLVPGVTGVAMFMNGRFRESLLALDRAEKLFRERCTGVAWERSSVRSFALWDLWFLGELNELARRAPLYLREAEERGDRYLAVNLRSSFSNACWLVQGDPDRARREADDAMASWSKADFYLQHALDLIARVQLDLYLGDGEAARRRLLDRQGDLRRSLALRGQLLRIVFAHLRGRAALAAACPSGDPDALLREAARAAHAIERERMPWSTPLAALLRAGIAASRGLPDASAPLLVAAIEGFGAAGMGAFEAVARRRLGEVIGGDEGRAALRAADDWLRTQGVFDLARMTAMMAPGFPG